MRVSVFLTDKCFLFGCVFVLLSFGVFFLD